MSQQTEAKETWVDLEKKLLPYQRASVDKICKHFENSGKALLADEVGLGKTFVAKGVVAKLAAEHGEWTDSHNRTYNLLKAMFPSMYHEEEK